MTAIVFDNLILDVNFMRISLSDSKQDVFPTRDVSLFDTIVARDIARINARIIGRLNPTGTDIASVEDTIAIGPRH